jgi:hypothetical protein
VVGWVTGLLTVPSSGLRIENSSGNRRTILDPVGMEARLDEGAACDRILDSQQRRAPVFGVK